VTGSECRPEGRYRWQVDRRPTAAVRLAPCRFSLTIAREGRHLVGLAIVGKGPVARFEHRLPAVDHVVVSLGDSVASGEGNPDARSDLSRARWFQRRCHRSLRAGPAQAALAVELANPHTAISLVPLGCSGATVPRGLLGSYAGVEPDGRVEPPQVDVLNGLARTRDIDAVLLSIGANDVFFSKILQFCAAVRDCPRRRFDPARPFAEAGPTRPPLDTAITAALRRLARRYARLDRALSRSIPRRRILIVEYFDPTRRPDGRPCSIRLGRTGITADEFRWARERVLLRLNATVSREAKRHGWRTVEGIDEAFAGHGICARPARLRWVRTPAQSFFRQDGLPAFASVSGTMHPNGRGHLATARLIRPRLADVLRLAPGQEAEASSARDDEDDVFGVRTTILLAVVASLVLAGVCTLLVLRRRRRARR
jgi:hypothetical protein